MKFLAVFVLVAAVLGGAQGEDDDDKGQQGLIAELMQHIQGCMGVVKDVNFGVCFTMFKNDSVLSDSKFDPCKCMIGCVEERFKVLGSDGQFDWNKYEEHKKRIEEPKYVDEAVKVSDQCKGKTAAGADNCGTGYNMFVCALEASPLAKDIVMALVKSLSGEDE